MRKILFVGLIFGIIACNSLGKLGEDFYTVTPKPLEVHAGKIKLDMQVAIPKDVFPKNALLEVTPVLLSVGGSEGEKYPSVSYQGEEFPGNNEVIPNKEGKTLTYTGEIDYSPELEKSNLYAYVVVKVGDETQNFDPIMLSKGVINTALLLEEDVKPILAKDTLQKVTPYSKAGKVNFLKNSANVRSSELKEEDFVAISEVIKSASKDGRIFLRDITLTGYASPEGEATFNENLSSDRAKKVNEKLASILKESKLSKKQLDSITVKEAGRGADWESFNVLLNESSIEGKDVIKRDLDSKTDLSDKEKAVSKLENAYPEIEGILSSIRRSEIVVNYEITSKTDEEILKHIKGDASALTAEEFLYGANNLLQSDEEKLEAFKKMTELFPQDYRGFNNAGVLYFDKEDIENAKASFTKSFEVLNNETTSSNLACVYILEGKYDEALQLLSNVSSPEARYNKGILNVISGEYQSAVENMTGHNTFNLALAKRLNSDFEGCIATLDAKGENDGKDDYLRAIAHMKAGRKEEAKKFLESADSKEKGLLDKAKEDLEFDVLFDEKGIDRTIEPEELKKRAIEASTMEDKQPSDTTGTSNENKKAVWFMH